MCVCIYIYIHMCVYIYIYIYIHRQGQQLWLIVHCYDLCHGLFAGGQAERGPPVGGNVAAHGLF